MTAIGTAVTAVGGVFAIAACGYAARRRGVLTHVGLSELSRLLIDFFLPASLFHSMFTQLDASRLDEVLLAGAGQIGLFASGLLWMALIIRIMHIASPRGTVLALGAIQNSVYMPLPIASVLLPADQAIRAQFYIGCLVIVFTPVLWSLGVLLLSGRASAVQETSRWRLVFNPPFVAALSGACTKLVFSAAGIGLPAPVLQFLATMGSATVPVAMVILGALLAEVKSLRAVEGRAVWGICLVKLALVPATILAVFALWQPSDPILRLVLFLEATAPPATNISIIVRRFGGDTQLVAAATFVAYLLSIATIPFWLVVAAAVI